MVYDFVEICVGVVSGGDDADGMRTIDYLKRCKRVMQLILSNDVSSLGLHPAVYFYSWTGKQQPILFLTIAAFMVELERNDKLRWLTGLRSDFEEFLMKSRTLMNQIIRKFGAKSSGANHLNKFYKRVLS